MMKNPLEQLKKDVLRRAGGAPSFGNTRREIRDTLDRFIAQYEALEVDKVGDDYFSNTCNVVGKLQTVLVLRKQEPKPDVTELARRAVKEWREGFVERQMAMGALSKAVDELLADKGGRR